MVGLIICFHQSAIAMKSDIFPFTSASGYKFLLTSDIYTPRSAEEKYFIMLCFRFSVISSNFKI